MGRIIFAEVDQTPITDHSLPTGISGEGRISSKAMFDTPDRPLTVWQHEMAPGAALQLDRPNFGHVFYVRSGGIEAEGEMLGEGGAVISEHLCTTSLRAGPEGAVLLDFHAPDSCADKPSKAGGHVHVVGERGILSIGNFKNTNLKDEAGYTGILWADSDCSTCELWLHQSSLVGPVPQEGSLHSHSADEIIFILDGAMLMGQRRVTAGTAMAIDGDTRYRVGVSEDGLAFLNFRTHGSVVSMFEQGAKEPVDERELWRVAQVL
jgi:hypothetical protein